MEQTSSSTHRVESTDAGPYGRCPIQTSQSMPEELHRKKPVIASAPDDANYREKQKIYCSINEALPGKV